MFFRYGAGARFGQGRTAHVLILERLVLEGVSDPELISVCEVMEDAPRVERMMDRCGDIFANGTVETLGIDESLRVVEVLIKRKQKRGFLVASDRSGERTFVELAFFWRLLVGEGIACVENGIAHQKIYRAVKIRRTTFGGDFQSCATRARVERGIWVLIDLYLLDRGRCHAWSVCLQAINYKRYSVGANGAIVEKSRKRGDVVLIENGHAVEGVSIDRVGVLVLGYVCRDPHRKVLGAYRNNLILRSDLHDDPDESGLVRANRNVLHRVAESACFDIDAVDSRRYFLEAEPAITVGCRVPNLDTALRRQRHAGVRNCRCRRIEHHARDCDRCFPTPLLVVGCIHSHSRPVLNAA